MRAGNCEGAREQAHRVRVRQADKGRKSSQNVCMHVTPANQIDELLVAEVPSLLQTDHRKVAIVVAIIARFSLCGRFTRAHSRVPC